MKIIISTIWELVKLPGVFIAVVVVEVMVSTEQEIGRQPYEVLGKCNRQRFMGGAKAPSVNESRKEGYVWN